KIKEIQEQILKSPIFNQLGQLDSSSRFARSLNVNSSVYDAYVAIQAGQKMEALRTQKRKRIADMKGTSNNRIIMRFYASDEYRELVIEHKVANCTECSNIMFSSLNKEYPNMPVELINMFDTNHAFNVINRDQSTSIFEPDTWNEDTLVVDAWKRAVYTKEEFLSVNLQDCDFKLNSGIKGKANQMMRYKDETSVFVFDKGRLKEEISML
ncbi:hypothetical protein BGC33_03555, partial [Bathymodiolus thermophilus thioautotrophic gill symbiont]